MVDMAQHQILPSALRYTGDLCAWVEKKTTVGVSSKAERALIAQLSHQTDALYDSIEGLKANLAAVPANAEAASKYYHNTVIPAMDILRKHADILEGLTDKSYWPYPTYSDLLYY